ncbi:DUF3226 domain-containing protein [Chthonomonas sp.]|uniref:DUF3226 domain-containing protein n=1 Tax=Chthonomonas sp. TaxID=2282153 RepID=UPI0039C8A2A1
MCTDRLKTKEITKPSLILVEGKDDQRFFEEACKQFHLVADVWGVGGKDGFKSVLKSTTGVRQLQNLLLVRDGDSDPRAAFQSLQDCLRNINLPYPQQPFRWHSQGSPRTAIAILPGPDSSGRLQQGTIEHLYLQVLANTDLLRCVDNFVSCCQGVDGTIEATSKMRVHAYLATKFEGLRLGEAVAKEFDWQHPVLSPLIDLLRQFKHR